MNAEAFQVNITIQNEMTMQHSHFKGWKIPNREWDLTAPRFIHGIYAQEGFNITITNPVAPDDESEAWKKV